MEVALGVAEFVGIAGGLITRIFRTVETVSLNKRECEQLASRLSTIRGVLTTLPEDPKVGPPLRQLNKTLHEADKLVVACQNGNAARQFFGASHHADCFTHVNNKILADTIVLNLLLSSLAVRLRSNPIRPPSGTGVPSPEMRSPTVPSPASSSSPQAVISHVSSIFDNPRIFTWAQILEVTSNFTIKLDGGCSALVYKGRLHDGPEVAVKVLNSTRGRQGKENAFMAEFDILIFLSLRHDHIVRPVGWCADEESEERVFVHEYMNNGTLSDHLQRQGGGSSSSPVTTSWRTRLQVLLGVSRAIQYLHHGAAQPVIHRKVTSSNILLDASWTPRLSGFGSALLQAAGGQLFGEVVGIFGYIDPEYNRTMKLSTASDVYSFGVVILEALTGSPPVNYGKPLADSALSDIQNKKKLRRALDRRLPSLKPTPQQLKALELVADTASRCLRPDGVARPTMSVVVADFEKALRIMASDA